MVAPHPPNAPSHSDEPRGAALRTQRNGGTGPALLRVNAFSFCLQAVQIGAVPTLIALRLNAGGFSIATLGIIAAAPWLAVALLGPAVPRLLARYGYFMVNASALALSAVAVVSILFVVSPLELLAANFCLGMGLTLRWVACDSWIIALAPAPLRGRAIGIHETLMGCGIAAGPGIIALFGGYTAAPLVACLGLLLAAVAALLSLKKYGSAAAVLVLPVPFSAGLLSLMALAAFISGFIETSSISFVPVLGLRAHWPMSGTLALGMFAVGGAVLQLPLGYLADVLGYRPAQLLAATLIALSSAAFIAFGWQPIVSLTTLFVLGGCAGAMNTLAVIEAGASVSAERIAGATACVALAYTAGSIIGPPLVGLVATSVGPSAFPYIFCAISLAFCAARFVRCAPGLADHRD